MGFQVILIVLQLISFLVTLKCDIDGRPEIPAKGFGGVLVTISVFATLAYLHFCCGSYSKLM